MLACLSMFAASVFLYIISYNYMFKFLYIISYNYMFKFSGQSFCFLYDCTYKNHHYLLLMFFFYLIRFLIVENVGFFMGLAHLLNKLYGV
jgi:hypothetical protein